MCLQVPRAVLKSCGLKEAFRHPQSQKGLDYCYCYIFVQCGRRASEFYEVAHGLQELEATTNRRTYFRTSLWRFEEQLLSEIIALAASVISHVFVAKLG